MDHEMSEEMSVCHPAHAAPVSIGMPVFNGGRFIEKALDSILEQSYGNFELIISDNASTDDTELICRAYAARDSRIRYVRQQTNMGAAANFRYVLQAAQHDRFIWAAADDWWDRDRLERLVAALGEDDSVVVGAVRRYVNGVLYAEYVPTSFSQGQWWRFLFREESRLEKIYFIYGLMWKSKALRPVSYFSDGYCQDAIFCYRLLWLGHLKSIPDATLHSTAHASSEGASAAKQFRYSVVRAIFMAHPWTYYRSYVDATPRERRWAVLAWIPVKHMASQIHLWWRAVRRFLLRRPYVYGALPGGEVRVWQARL